jgi:Protein of unknown function (DUF559)/Transcriptional regulator, AbiEi antitoxin
MRHQSARDAAGQWIAALAAEQDSVVSTAQLRAAGLDGPAVARRVRRGVLHPVHREVYAVGHPRLGVRGRWMAAALACGPAAFVSHRAAAAAWDLLPWGGGLVDVTIAGRNGRRGHRGVRVHRVGALPEQQRAAIDGLPVTSAERTLADLAAVLMLRRLEQALERAEARRLVDHAVLAELAAARRPGVGRLRAVLATPPSMTRSELEVAFLALCDRHGLPCPRVNQRIGPYEVDFVWPAHRLVVETDGAERHLTRRAFEIDRARDAALTAGGWRVVRFTHRQVTHEPAGVAAVLRALLS